MLAISARRVAVTGLLALAGLGLASCGDSEPGSTASAPAQASPGRPNIVVVMLDDLAPSQAHPRYLPRVSKLLRDQGTSFENAFLTTPLCCPSRAALLTGQYGHNNGVLTNSYPALRDRRNVLPVWLQEAGYVTAHVGKFLNRYHHFRNRTAVAPGWDQWYTELDTSEDDYYDWDLSRNGKKIHYGHRNSDYAPRIFERSALRLIRRFVPGDKPLYLSSTRSPLIRAAGARGRAVRTARYPLPATWAGSRTRSFRARPRSTRPNVSDKPSFLRTQPL